MKTLNLKKALTVEIKADVEERTLTAIASTGNPDRDNDILPVNGWKLENFMKNPVMLYGHNSRDLPIATVTDIQPTEDALIFKARFPKQGIHDFADRVYELYKDGILKAFSVRFMSKDYEKNEYGGLTFKESELLEISAVTIPANAEALVQEVKQLKERESMELETIQEEMKEIKELLSKKEPEPVQVQIPKEWTEMLEKTTKQLEARLADAEKQMAEAQQKAAEAEEKVKEKEKAEVGILKTAPAVIEPHTDATRVKDFFSALIGKDYIGLKDLSEGQDKYGGYLVPTEFRDNVLRIMSDAGVARQEATVIPMKTNSLTIPKETDKPAVTWVSEAGQIATGTPEFGQVTLTAKKAGLIIPMTTELFEDSAPDMQNILAKQFAESLAEAEDTQAVAGDGTVFTGILNDSDVHSVSMGAGDTAFTNLSLMDMFTLIAALKRNVAKNGKFFMNQTVWAYVKNMTDTNGNLIFAPTEKTLLGYPVVIMDDMNAYSASAADTVMMGFGDLRNIYLGDRRQISIALADQATVGTTNIFEKDMLALRVTERVAIAIALSKALALLKTAAE